LFHALPLSRTTLLSLITICTTVALFATGATFAITSSDSAAGTVTAASAAITVDGTGGGGSISFAAGTNCPGALNPGNTCGPDLITVTSASATPLSLTGPVSGVAVVDSHSPAGCDGSTTNWLVTTTPLTTSTLSGLGSTATFEVSVRLQAGAVAGCQGETATVTVTVNSASS
jgi:hypothetical protein